jgi:hypothetical protein
MDQSIAGFTVEAPRRFLRDWALTVLLPGAGLGGFAVAVFDSNDRPDDWMFIFLLGTPVLFWFVVGVLQARLLRSLIERPKVWAAATWGGGSLALIGGTITFIWLTVWIDEIGAIGFDAGDPAAILLFALSGVVAGLILGFLQAVTMRANWSERGYWLGWSAGGGALAFLVLWVGINALVNLSEQGLIEFGQVGFNGTIAGFLLAGAVAHSLLTGIGLRRLLARRARRRKEALVGQFD